MEIIDYFPYRKASVPESSTKRTAYWGAYDFPHNKVTSVHFDDCIVVVDRDLVKGLERELFRLAGRPQDNHTTFHYIDDSGVARAVWFHDANALFGKPEDIDHE